MMNRKNWNQTRLTKLLGIQYPIIQGPFGGGLSSSNLASIVSNLGGMGSYGAQPLSPDKILDIDREIKTKTLRPYALNIWVSNKDINASSYSNEEYEKLCRLFKPYFDKLSVSLPEKPQIPSFQFEEQVQAIMEAKPPVFSFVFGIPSQEVLENCRRRKIIIIGTATTLEEALALEDAGVDAIVATGFEAGGHRVSFIRSPEASLTGTFVLIQQIADQVKIPIIAAGGIADGRGIVAALTLGADGVQIGTAFLACEESNATFEHKAQLFSEAAHHTVLTKMFSGRLARGMTSRIFEELKSQENNFAPYPIQRIFINNLTAAAIAQGKPELITFWAGQIASNLKYNKANELFNSLLAQVESVYN